MNKRKSIIILLSVVIIILLGVIGYLLINNYNNQPDSSSQNNTNNQQNSDNTTNKTATETYCTKYEKLCFEYPSTWTLDAKEDVVEGTQTPTDRVTLTAPDKKLTLNMFAGVYGIGAGACESQGKIYVKDSRKNKMSDSNDKAKPTYAIKYITEQDGKFVPAVMLTSDKEDGNGIFKVGEYDWCLARFSHLFDASTVSVGQNGSPLMYFTTESSRTTGENNNVSESFSTMAEAEEAINTTNYQQAFDILASARYN